MGRRRAGRGRSGLSEIAAMLIFIIVLVVLGSKLWQRQFPRSEVWQVVRVSDGDTLKVQSGGRRETIRFCGIDAPELAQPLGNESRDNLKRLVDKARGRVVVRAVKRDQYDRIVGEVFVAAPTPQQPKQERLLDDEQVVAGMAYVYRRDVGECPNGNSLSRSETDSPRSKILSQAIIISSNALLPAC